MNSAWDIFKSSIDILKKDWKYLLKTYSVTVIVPILAVGILAITMTSIVGLYYRGNGPSAPVATLILLPITVLCLIVFAWVVPILLMAIKSVLDGKYTPVAELFGQARKFVLPFLWTGLLSGLAVSAGLALLVVPGVIFAVWFIFAQYLVIEDGLSGVAALKASYNLVKGRFWRVLGYSVFVMLISFVVSLLTGAGSSLLQKAGLGILTIVLSLASAVFSIVINAVTPIYMYLAYRHFKSNRT